MLTVFKCLYVLIGIKHPNYISHGSLIISIIGTQTVKSHILVIITLHTIFASLVIFLQTVIFQRLFGDFPHLQLPAAGEFKRNLMS